MVSLVEFLCLLLVVVVLGLEPIHLLQLVVERWDISTGELKCIIEITSIIRCVIIVQHASIVVQGSHRVVMFILILGKTSLRVGIIRMTHIQIISLILGLICTSLSFFRGQKLLISHLSLSLSLLVYNRYTRHDN